LFFPYAFNRIGKSTTFGTLAAMSMLQAVFTWFFIPETKGKSLKKSKNLARKGAEQSRHESG